MPGNLIDEQRIVVGILSTANSSSTPINDGASFVGTWEDAVKYDSLVIALETDQNGYFEVEFSANGSDVDELHTKYFRTDRINLSHRFVISRQFFRVKFHNDSGTNQTYFRMQVKFGQISPLSVCGDAQVAQTMEALNVRPTDFTTEVALGKREGYSSWALVGTNADVDTGTIEIVASFGGAFNQKLASAETLDVVSSDANDTNSSGTGARQIKIYGVDANWNQLEETVSLNGVTPVTTSGSFFGVNEVKVVSSGTGLTNAGTISITATTSGNTMAEVPAGKGASQQCLFYVPRKHNFLIHWLRVEAVKPSGSDPIVNTYLNSHDTVTNTTIERNHDEFNTVEQNIVDLPLPEPIVISEKNIVWLAADTDANNTKFKGRFSGKLFRSADA